MASLSRRGKLDTVSQSGNESAKHYRGMRMELPYHLPVFQAASKGVLISSASLKLRPNNRAESVIASGQQVDAAYHKVRVHEQHPA